MAIDTAIFLAMTLAAPLSAFLFNADLFAPWRVYLGIYGLLLTINSFAFSQFQYPWSITTHIIFWTGAASFMAGCALAEALFRAKNPHWTFSISNFKNRLQQDSNRMDWKWFKGIWAISLWIYLISFAISWVIIGNLPVFDKDPDQARIHFFTANVLTNYGIFFGPVSLMLAGEMLMAAPLQGKEKKIIWLGILATAVSYSAIITRYELFRVAIFLIIIYHYLKGPLKIRHLISAGLALIGVFVGVLLIRAGTNAFDAYQDSVRIRMPNGWGWAGSIYAYLASDFWNFDYAIRKYFDGDHYYPTQFGFGLSRGLLALSRMEGGWIAAFNFDSIMNESVIMVKGYNTIIYMWHLLKDFGVTGLYLISLIASFSLTAFHMNNFERGSIFRLSIFAFLTVGVALSYHTPLWELWFFYHNLLIFFLAHKKIRISSSSM